jgi:hypothetical protein
MHLTPKELDKLHRRTDRGSQGLGEEFFPCKLADLRCATRSSSPRKSRSPLRRPGGRSAGLGSHDLVLDLW